MNFVDWSASTDVPIVTNSNTVGRLGFTNSDKDFVFGAFIEAQLSTDLNHRLSLEAFGRYDWSEKVKGDVGPTEFETDLGGFSLGVGLNYQF